MLSAAAASHGGIVLTGGCSHPLPCYLRSEKEKKVSLHRPELTLDGFEWVMLLLLFQIGNFAAPSNSPGQ